MYKMYVISSQLLKNLLLLILFFLATGLVFSILSHAEQIIKLILNMYLSPKRINLQATKFDYRVSGLENGFG